MHFWCSGLREQGGGIEAYTLALVKAACDWPGCGAVTVCAKNERRAAPAGYRHFVTGGVPPAFRTAAFSASPTGMMRHSGFSLFHT